MAGRDHDAAAGFEKRRGEIDHLGATQANIENVDARLDQSFGDGFRELPARQAHVAADNDGPGVDEFRSGISDAIADVGVQLVWNLAPNIVGLEAIDRDGHGSYSYVLVPSRP